MQIKIKEYDSDGSIWLTFGKKEHNEISTLIDKEEIPDLIDNFKGIIAQLEGIYFTEFLKEVKNVHPTQ